MGMVPVRRIDNTIFEMDMVCFAVRSMKFFSLLAERKWNVRPEILELDKLVIP